MRDTKKIERETQIKKERYTRKRKYDRDTR